MMMMIEETAPFSRANDGESLGAGAKNGRELGKYLLTWWNLAVSWRGIGNCNCLLVDLTADS